MKSALIVEDFRPIAEIWRSTLAKENFEPIKIIDNTDLVEDCIVELNPSLILMDINLNGSRDGIETTEDLIKKMPDLKIIILTMHAQPHLFEKALESGASGYIVKSSPIKELRDAVEVVLNGGIYICERMRPHWKG